MHVARDGGRGTSLRDATRTVDLVQRAPVDLRGHLSDQLWIEPVGQLIVARLRGVPTVDLLKECQQRVLLLAQGTASPRVLYDALELVSPAVDVPWSQRELDEHPDARRLRRAVVVPSTRLAFLARLAFGEGDYRVFYNDIALAIRWLEEPTAFELKLVR